MRFVPFVTHATFGIKLCLAVLVVVTVIGVALLAMERRHPRSLVATALALVVVSGVWLRVNKPVEGTVLEVVSHNHGVTLADMIVLPCLAVAAGLVWVARREWRAASSAPADVSPRLAADTREP